MLRYTEAYPLIRIVIVPAAETSRFPGMSIVAHDGAIAALAGITFRERTRAGFDSEDEFLDAAARGAADLNTFESLAEATEFARRQVAFLIEKARRIEEAMNRIAAFPATKKAPQSSSVAVPPGKKTMAARN